MIKPLSISIVTPSFNQGAFIEEALDSVSVQDYPNYEHIVIDGMSTDGTMEVLQSFQKAKAFPHLSWICEPDNGQSEALNKGFRRATGDIIGWLNADDRYRAGCFNHVAELFQRNPDVDIVYGDYAVVGQFGEFIRVKPEIAFSVLVLFYHRTLYIPTTATFFRRRVFDEGNWLNEKLDYAMDLEFFIRLAIKGYNFEHLAKLLADFRLQPNSKTCRHADKQQREHKGVVLTTVPVFREVKSVKIKKALLYVFRLGAGFLRYGKKLIHGSYLIQLNVRYFRKFG